MENWETLDVDDSDLPSLLRPCINTNKRKHRNFSPNPSSQTLTPPQQQRRRIPGPAGAVQAAMERKRRGGCGRGEEEVSARECVGREVGEDGDGGGGDDFRLGPWRCAVEFVSRLGPLPSITPLSSIPKFLDIGRIDRVVAVIESCTPNGLGDLMVTLKDPTGTTGASIHRKVFDDGEFGKEILVGSVLILQKVAIFAPSRSAFYLNITRSNVVKIISKDSGAPSNQNTHTSAVESIPGPYTETSVNVEVPSMEVEMTQGIDDGIGQSSNLTSSVNISKEMAKEKSAISFIRGDQIDTSAEQVLKNVFGKETICNEQRGLSTAANLDEGHNREGSTRINGVEKEKQLPTARAFLPEWTDEQLNELFDVDYEDDCPFF